MKLIDYENFVKGYERLCKDTGYYFDITEGDTLGIFLLRANLAAFEQQIKDIGGTND